MTNISKPNISDFYYIFAENGLKKVPKDILVDETLCFGVIANGNSDCYTYQKLPAIEALDKNFFPNSTFLVIVDATGELKTFLRLLGINVETTDFYKIPIVHIHGLEFNETVSMRASHEFIPGCNA